MKRSEVTSRHGQRWRQLLVVSLGVACIGGVWTASGATAGGPKDDSVKGNGELVGSSTNRFHLNAKSGPMGEDPKGHADVKDNENKISFKGDVTCLRVDGNRATMVVEFEKTRNVDPSREASRIAVLDVGDGKRHDPPDMIGLRTVPAGTPCPDPNLQPTNGVVMKGDIRVEDN